MHLNLVDSWLDLGFLDQISQNFIVKVAHTDGPDFLLFIQFLKSPVALESLGPIISRPVHQSQVKVVGLEVVQGLLD